jgi:hypothetical protein
LDENLAKDNSMQFNAGSIDSNDHSQYKTSSGRTSTAKSVWQPKKQTVLLGCPGG